MAKKTSIWQSGITSPQHVQQLEALYKVSQILATGTRQQEALAEVEADLAAGITHVDVMLARWMEQLEKGDPISKGQRLEFRRNKVRAVQRVLVGVDKLFSRAGSAAIWSTRPLERYWRDLRTGGTHLSNMADIIYFAWADHEFDTGVNRVVMH